MLLLQCAEGGRAAACCTCSWSCPPLALRLTSLLCACECSLFPLCIVMRRCASLLAASSRASVARSIPSAAPLARTVHSSAALQQTSSFSGSSSGAASAGASKEWIPKPVYSSYKIYKSKTALDIAVVRAQLAYGGADKSYLALKRPGGLRFTFAAGEDKRYEWDNSQVTHHTKEAGAVAQASLCSS